jgi:pimeloyl-ACP methyl ester carboxylesterase
MRNTTGAKPVSAARAALMLLFALLAAGGDTSTERWDCLTPATPPAAATGRLLILPGVGNTRFHLAGFVEAAEQQLPHFEVEVRTWGVPFLTIHNLRAHDRNVATAAEIAADITAWRRSHPTEKFYLVGYSGGGGMVVLVAAALPDDVAIDRLILVAPAISPDYPIVEAVMPHVREFVANFASDRDLQVGWGTSTFGTIDRKMTESAGAIGFAAENPRLLQHLWSLDDVAFGHHGNHLSYLNRRWQDAKLLPALDPALTVEQVRAAWASTCREL